MAVITTSQKSEPKGLEILAKKHLKYNHKTRPITATLEYPLILDIKLLKKLDMTTFTKKGLIALSKFCGISLIKQTETKRKLNKCIKTIQYSKKQYGNEYNELSATVITESNKNYRIKRKLGRQNGKMKPRIRFKIGKEETSADEDSLDIVCKKHTKVLKACVQKKDEKTSDMRCITENILSTDSRENIIPEPCKTCNRSEHPERLHSHPKMLTRYALHEKANTKNLEERLTNVLSTRNAEEMEGKEEMRQNPCAKEGDCDSFQNSLLSCEQNEEKFSGKSNPSRFGLKTNSLIAVSSPEAEQKTKSKNFRKSLVTPSSSSAKPKGDILKKSNSKGALNDKEDDKIMTADEDMKFVTGCYICGKQVSPKLRIKHEKNCILEWRSQNKLCSPDKRKPEPRRPDFRFTASGDVDCEGTFESIWANHIDSLVPCRKCGRKFFPDRIERHENCCNNAPISVKYKH